VVKDERVDLEHLRAAPAIGRRSRTQSRSRQTSLQRNWRA
jgi:hypothetical protein